MLGQTGRAPFAVPLGQATGEEPTPDASQSADGLMSAADKTKLDNMMATWSTSLVRYFLWDPAAGSDTATGYVDAAAGATITPGSLARLTWASLSGIIPRVGAGRTMVILIKGGATSTETVDLSPFTGYRQILVRGSTDLTNSAGDKITAGAAIATAGPGGNSEFTATVGATTTTVPIASGSFGSEPTSVQYRLRFLATTTTSTLRNVCRVITAHTTTVATLETALPATPASGDTFVIERPGAIVAGLIATGIVAGPLVPVAGANPLQIAGLGFTTTASDGVIISHGTAQMSFCEIRTTSANFVWRFQAMMLMRVQSSYTDETPASVTTGMGLRTAAAGTVGAVAQLNFTQSGHMHTTNAPAVSGVPIGLFGVGSYFACGVTFQGCGNGGAMQTPNNNNGFTCGSASSSNARARVNASRSGGAIQIINSTMNIVRMDFANCTAPCITDGNGANAQSYGGTLAIDDCTGSSGNTNVGLHVNLASSGLTLNAARNYVLGRTNANTVTGTQGDIRITGTSGSAGILTTWTGLQTTGFRDPWGNTFVGSGSGTAQQVVETLAFTNNDGGAHTIGDIVRVSAAGQVVKAQADTAAHATGPLYVAVTPPAAAALGLYAPLAQATPWVNFDAAAPAVASLVYLSPGTAGQATVTVPAAAATNQKRRLGFVVVSSGSAGLISGSPENLTVTSDGVAP